MTPRFKPKIRRAQIIEHANLLSVRHGPDGWTIRQLAESLGVTKQAIYYHFPSIVTIRRRVLADAKRRVKNG